MVDDMKKKMRRFEHLIGFTGILDVTSRDATKRLIGALNTRYKHDVQNSLRLHRLEFFYDLVEGKRRKGCQKDEIKNVPVEKEKKKATKEEEDQQEEVSQKSSESVKSDDVLSIQAKDVDDWKDLMTLSKIYYVLEHPRSEGLTWKRRITKKRKIDKFGDMDLIEWRVTQNFRLRGLEEWAQSRSDARKLAEQQNDTDDLESDLDEDARELEELYDMLDPSGEKHKLSKTEKSRKGLSTADRPFKFQDECIEDWTESYSEDSDYSDAEDTVEEIEDFPDEMERKMGEFDETKMLMYDEEESISELFSKYPEFLPYREEIFEQMDKAETLEEWYELYHKICIVSDGPKEDKQLSQIMEEEEEEVEEQQGEVPIEEPKEEIAKPEEASEEIEMSLADDQLEEKELEDVTMIEKEGKEHDIFEKEKLSGKETDEQEVAEIPQTKAEIKELSKREGETEVESLEEEETVKIEATKGVAEENGKGAEAETDVKEAAIMEEEGTEEQMESKELRIESEKEEETVKLEAAKGVTEETGKGTEAETDVKEAAVMEEEGTEEQMESKELRIESEKEEETVKLEAAKGVTEETGKGTEAGTDVKEAAVIEEEGTEEQMESKELRIESEKEEETVKLEAAKAVTEETGKGTEAGTEVQEEAAKVSKMEKEETEEQTESKELGIESQKEEDIVKQELEKELEQETTKEYVIKGSETKLNGQEKDLILEEHELYTTAEADKDREEDVVNDPSQVSSDDPNDTIASSKDISGKTIDNETTNQTNIEAKKTAKKSVSQEEDTGRKSDDEPNADS